jgi:hypothetical protein
MPKKTAEHVIANPAHKGLLQCLHCGGTYLPSLPAPAGVYAAILNSFADEHRRCKLGPKGEACTYCLEFGHKPEVCERLKVKTPREWLQGPDTGYSSKTICRVAIGDTPEHPSTPMDPSDFGRCHRLLKLFPWMRAKLPAVADGYPAWGPLVREWDTLTALYEEELPSGTAPKLCARMKELRAEGRS